MKLHMPTGRTRNGLELQPVEPVARPAGRGDIPELHRLYSQPHIVRGTGVPVFATLETTAEWVEQALTQGHLLVAAAGEEIAGALLLKRFDAPIRRYAAEICRVGVGDGWQGRGVGSLLIAAAVDLAERWLNVHRIELMVRADNPVARHLYRKHGFEEEGLLRSYGFRDGEYVDIIPMARLSGPLRRE